MKFVRCRATVMSVSDVALADVQDESVLSVRGLQQDGSSQSLTTSKRYQLYVCGIVIFDHSRSGVRYNFGRVCLCVCMSVRR